MTVPIRHIRSFVRRQGRLTAGQQRALQALWQRYGIDIAEGFLERRALFNESQQLILEIGFGNGDSLLHQAQAHPQTAYLGVEVYEPGVGRLLQQLAQQQINNVRVICHDAVEVIRHHIADNSLDGVQIFFPDPWPKKRHHKRRLIQSDFIDLLTPKLKNEAYLHLATDWQPYAEHMLAVLSAQSDLINCASDKRYYPRPAHRPLTKFEQRGERLGHEVFDLMFQRCAQSS